MSVNILNGDVREILPTLPSNHYDCVVTSPPYWGLRDYGVEGQIGLEPTMQGYLDTMVGVCRELRRVLKPEGTFWLNIGDSYATQPPGNKTGSVKASSGLPNSAENLERRLKEYNKTRIFSGLKLKDLCMIPNRLAIALQEDGWYVRSEIIWHKPNPMPESIKDRPTSAHEKVWLLTKNEKYYYDADAIKENGVVPAGTRRTIGKPKSEAVGFAIVSGTRNARNVWSIPPKPFKGAHFATMPPELAERCIKAGCPVGGEVLDPFGGSGTTGFVARNLGMNATLIELNRDYVEISKARISDNSRLL